MGASDLINAITLFPGLLAFYLLTRGKDLGRLVLLAFLPTLLLFPLYYEFRLPHLPPITFTTSVSLVLGFALLPRIKTVKLRSIDLWVALFIAGMAISEARSTSLANGGLQLFSSILDLGVPYLVGRLVIEQDEIREKFVKTFVGLMAVVVAFCVPEFLVGKNMFQLFGRLFFVNQPSVWGTQMRWGFARVAGPFAHAILAGMMFSVAVLFANWIMVNNPDWCKRQLVASLLPSLRKTLVIAFLLGLYMTQSRGPWIGAAFGAAVASLGVARNFKRRASALLLVLCIVGPIGYSIGDRYTSESAQSGSSEEDRQSAMYRRELIPAYMPLIQQGGLFGWGIVNYPTAHGQRSIDNEYLLLGVTQGYWGFAMFLLIIGEATLVLVLCIPNMKARRDRTFVFMLLGMLAGICLSITTVFIAYQVDQLLFLLVGWSCSLKHAKLGAGDQSTVEPVHARFEKVYS